MTEFYRFPRTPHLAWLGSGGPRDDKVLSAAEASLFLARDIIVEEKVDGANVGLSVGDDGCLRAQNRGGYLKREHCHPQFRPLFGWLAPREQRIAQALGSDLMLFGEWCYAVHSVKYTRLPDWFLAFDVYDLGRARFWSTRRRDALAVDLGLQTIPRIGEGRQSIESLRAHLGLSRLGIGWAEGLYLRSEDSDWLLNRAKLVRPEFAQSIGKHWSRRMLEVNRRTSDPQTMRPSGKTLREKRA